MVSDSYGYKKIEIESKRISPSTSQFYTGLNSWYSKHYFYNFLGKRKNMYILSFKAPMAT